MFEARTMKKLFLSVLTTVLLALPAAAEPARPLTEILPEFEKAAVGLQKEAQVPGMSIAVVYRDEVVFLKGFGTRDLEKKLPVDADTVFQLASCSKPMTSTALASLVSDGTISFNEPVVRWLPEFQMSDPWIASEVTFADLLAHRSGVPGQSGDILELLGYSQSEIFHKFRYLRKAYPFRAGYAYSNFAFTAAGVAGGRAIGTDFAGLMDKTLFEPLAMTNSSARFADYEKTQNRAISYFLEGENAIPTVRRPDPQAPAGGMSSTARDLASWVRLHLKKGEWEGKRLIDESALNETYQIQAVTSNNPANFSGRGYYGLGWVVGHDRKGRLQLSHSGAFAVGVRSAVTLIPEEEVGILVLSNAFPSALPEGVSTLFLNAYDTGRIDTDLARSTQKQVLDAILGMAGSATVAKPAGAAQPPLKLSSYLGRYGNDYYGTTEVTQKGDRLQLRIGKYDFRLTHLTGNTFSAKAITDEFDDLGPFEVRFTVDGDGRVNGFQQDQLEEPHWFGRSES